MYWQLGCNRSFVFPIGNAVGGYCPSSIL